VGGATAVTDACAVEIAPALSLTVTLAVYVPANI
jgi:hypothetical protein